MRIAVHYVVTEIKRGETNIPSLMHHGNHRELISLAAMQQRGYCRESCTVFRLIPNVPCFLPLALADIMTDCEGKSLEPIPLQAPQGTTTRRRASLKRIIGHLTSVTILPKEEEPDCGSACDPPSCTTESAVVSSRLLFCCPRHHLSF